MGATYAELHVAGRVFVLRRCTYGVSQATGPRGRPIEQVRHLGIDGEMDVPRDPFMKWWAAEAHMPLAGYITFSGGPGEPAIETVSWEAGQCVGYGEKFQRGSITDGSYTCQWRIVAAKLVFGTTPPKPFVAAAPREHGPPPLALVPPVPPLPPLLPLNKQGRYNARMALMQRARTGLVTNPNETAQTALTRLARNNVAVERARLSDHVYYSELIPPKPEPEGWHMFDTEELAQLGVSPDMLLDSKSGFKAAIYQSSFEQPPKLVVAYAGTEDGKDILSDIKQGVGLREKQYNQAMKLVDAVTKNIDKDGVETTGHSLGGGLASAATVVTGTKGYTFNAAGLHANTVKRPPYGVSRAEMEDKATLIDAYRSTSDPLNNFQNGLNARNGFVGPKALGVSHPLTPAAQWQHEWSGLVKGNPLKALKAMAKDGHGIAPQMVDHIEAEKDQDTAALTSYLAP